MEWMLLPFKRYVQFRGRSQRKEYWMYFLFIIIVSVVISIIESVLGLKGSSAIGPGQPAVSATYGFGTNQGILSNIFFLATFLPSLAVGVRRLHDTNRSGWWILLPLIPWVLGAILFFVGMFSAQYALLVLGIVLLVAGFGCSILLLVWYCTKGTDGPNDYGPDPLDPSGSADLGEVFS